MPPERCRFLRRQLGWSQEALAEKAMLSVSGVRSFELGRGSSRGYVPGSLRRAFEGAGVRMDSDEAP
ncbi:helix-turn-helix domain-containing protein [Azospirillum argentinense]|uniref:helix-turn-helix domain-containing protein n=1 Tax=Azospirillum argentinense TaxID=2970906 RepID=UPI00190CEB60|nr:helix-turn-helix domain-containing protein [Azospirillum argentinense]